MTECQYRFRCHHYDATDEVCTTPARAAYCHIYQKQIIREKIARDKESKLIDLKFGSQREER